MPSRKTDRATPDLIGGTELQTARIATVAPIQPIDRLYSYIVPEPLRKAVVPGVRVEVPMGRGDRPTMGFCVGVSDGPWDTTLKPVLSVVDDRPMLGEKLLELGRWIARYYFAPLGRTLHLMVPAGAKRQAGWKKVRYVSLRPAQSPPATDANQRLAATPQACAPTTKPPKRLSAKQDRVLTILQNAEGPVRLDDCASQAGCGLAVIGSLAKRGLVAIETRLEPTLPRLEPIERHEPDFQPNEDQHAAIKQLSAEVLAGRFSVQVLFGVTGSGKTECYVAAVRQTLALGRQAIILVPEIALTTQTVRRLQARFDRMATLHSGLSDAERSRFWAAIASGDLPVVIGTRSAVFAPCPNLGLIVVDEEAEGSYKSLSSPYYHTRDVAITRAHLEGIPVVRGSATPSIETWRNLKQRPHYHLIRLPHRVRDLPMPTMHLVDMRDEHRNRSGIHLLSQEMETRLGEALGRGEQAVLLLNRRGYASFLHCPRCKTAVTCPHCSVHMVFHATTELAHCHYCHAKLVVPTHCQMLGCGGKLVKFGIGVQRVEQELREKFPTARIRRVDSDVMLRVEDYSEVLGAFERQAFDVLVGTQMIAKGLDFPFVSFVGVVSADTALSLDDFRSEERTFQLVLQVAGRSGRGPSTQGQGVVVVQTFAIDTAPIQHAVRGDYEGFADAELARRRRAKLPPFTRMVRIVLADGSMSQLNKAGERLAENLREAMERRGIPHELFGPHPAPLTRLRDKYRHDLQLFFPTATALLTAFDLFKSEGLLKARVKRLVVDVDPISLQ